MSIYIYIYVRGATFCIRSEGCDVLIRPRDPGDYFFAGGEWNRLRLCKIVIPETIYYKESRHLSSYRRSCESRTVSIFEGRRSETRSISDPRGIPSTRFRKRRRFQEDGQRKRERERERETSWREFGAANS